MNLGKFEPLIINGEVHFAFCPFQIWSDGKYAKRPLISFVLPSASQKFKYGNTIYDFWIVFPKDQCGDFFLPSKLFPKCKWCNFAPRPLNSFEFATVLCKYK